MTGDFLNVFSRKTSDKTYFLDLTREDGRLLPLNTALIHVIAACVKCNAYLVFDTLAELVLCQQFNENQPYIFVEQDEITIVQTFKPVSWIQLEYLNY